MCHKFSSKSNERMKGVHPDLIVIFTEAIKNSPIDFGIPGGGGMRTTQDQQALFDNGKSKCDGVENKSYHQTGNALDFYAYVNGKASWSINHLCLVAGVIMTTAKRLKKEGKVSHDIYWGGQFGSSDFNGWDMPHIELVGDL
jgi:peptidoglycan L-alanyl-D-glutamate endopeptidase CwlK